MAETRYRSLDTPKGFEGGEGTKATNDTDHNDKALRTKPRTFFEIVSFERIIWVFLAIFVCYYTEFVPTLMHDGEIDRSWLAAALLFFTITSFVFIFIVFYLSFIRGITSDAWSLHYPAAIPIATASIILFEICLCVSIWPVYSFLSPAILLIFTIATVCLICMLDVFTFLCKH